MLLARGHLLYGGPWEAAVDYFEGLGYPCPMYKNPTDVYINLASLDLDTVMALSKSFAKERVSRGWRAGGLEASRGG